MNIKITGTFLIGFILLGYGFIIIQQDQKAKPMISGKLLSLCDPQLEAYKIPGSIALPSSRDIPSYGNRDSSLIAFLQNAADSFSWKTFIAINWAAGDGGGADSSTCFVEDYKNAVWQDWMPSSKIYSGGTPARWTKNNFRNSFVESKLGKDSVATNLEVDDYPLIAQNKMYTLFEVFYNRSAYDYVVNTGLYSLKGQTQFVKNYPNLTRGLTILIGNDTMNIAKTYQRAYFSVGNVKDSLETRGDTTYLFTTDPGAMIIKTAWLPLTSKDDQSKYFTRSIRSKVNKGVKVDTYGLVGMHIMHKVAEETQWVWSTFEHINVSPELDASHRPIIDPSKDYLYFNKAVTDTALVNKPPASKFEKDVFKRIPTQVGRLRSIEKSTQKVNDYYQSLIRAANPNSRWLNYRLVGTQWAFDPELFTKGAKYQPSHLANTVMETYIQKNSSCMNCHSKARFLQTDATAGYGYSADFVWGLNHVK